MDLHAQNQDDPRVWSHRSTDQPTSYGVLFHDTHAAVTVARHREIGPFDDPHRAVGVVVDYERYLAIAGRHLRLLSSTATRGSALKSRQHRELVDRLAALSMERHGGNAWTRAGDRLGLAHDVLATHVGARGELRTPEAGVLDRPEVQVAATMRTLALVREPLLLARDLLQAARTAQPRRDAPLTHALSAHLHQTTTVIARSLTRTSLHDIPVGDVLGPLDRLTPATTLVGAGSDPDVLFSRISALRTLRQLCYRQSLGAETANAHTLQELCRLAASTCRAAEALLPMASTPLGRVQRAATVDKLRHAAGLWTELDRGLVPRVMGLSRAPAIYRDAIRIATTDVDRAPAVAKATLAALPGLAAQAADIVDRLQERHELVIARPRAPGALGGRWEQLDPIGGRVLATGFITAGAATREAADAFVSASASARVAERTQADVPARRRERGVSR